MVYELLFVAFAWPNLCSLGLSLLVLVGRNYVSGICTLKSKNLLKHNPIFCFKKN